MVNCPSCDKKGKVVGIPVAIQLCEEHGLFNALTGETVEQVYERVING